MPGFVPHMGKLRGLPTNDHHLNYRWDTDEAEVLFSVTRLGNSVSCHFASDLQGLYRIRKAIDEFADFIFSTCPWCRMILLKITSDKIERLIRRCGFEKLTTIGDVKIYIRRRPWVC
jgi:hypothetical protein